VTCSPDPYRNWLCAPGRAVVQAPLTLALDRTLGVNDTGSRHRMKRRKRRTKKALSRSWHAGTPAFATSRMCGIADALATPRALLLFP